MPDDWGDLKPWRPGDKARKVPEENECYKGNTIHMGEVRRLNIGRGVRLYLERRAEKKFDDFRAKHPSIEYHSGE